MTEKEILSTLPIINLNGTIENEAEYRKEITDYPLETQIHTLKKTIVERIQKKFQDTYKAQQSLANGHLYRMEFNGEEFNIFAVSPKHLEECVRQFYGTLFKLADTQKRRIHVRLDLGDALWKPYVEVNSETVTHLIPMYERLSRFEPLSLYKNFGTCVIHSEPSNKVTQTNMNEKMILQLKRLPIGIYKCGNDQKLKDMADWKYTTLYSTIYKFLYRLVDITGTNRNDFMVIPKTEYFHSLTDLDLTTLENDIKPHFIAPVKEKEGYYIYKKDKTFYEIKIHK